MAFLRRICSSRPGDGEQRGQSLAALTARGRGLYCFQPCHGSLSCAQAGHCVSKQIGRHDAACQGCPRCVSRSPEAHCFRVLARAVRVSQPAVLSALLVIQLSGIVISPPNFPKEHKKERCDHFSVAALLHYISWCASDYSVVGRISCHVPYDNIGINVCQRSFAEFFLAAADSESNGFYQ